VRAPQISFAQLVQDFFLRRLVQQRGSMLLFAWLIPFDSPEHATRQRGVLGALISAAATAFAFADYRPLRGSALVCAHAALVGLTGPSQGQQPRCYGAGSRRAEVSFCDNTLANVCASPGQRADT
jgi:hypothetical protein